MYIIDQGSSVKMAGYWPTSLFTFLWTETKSRSIKTQKENEGQCRGILTELAWAIKDLLYGIKTTEKMIFIRVYFRELKRRPVTVICNGDNAFQISRFLVPSYDGPKFKSATAISI